MQRKYYELSLAQKILFVSQKYTIYKQVNNICTSVLVDVDLDYHTMREAITLAYQRNDSLRIRIVAKKKETKQYFAEHEDPSIGYLNFVGKSPQYMEKEIHKIAKKSVSIFGEQMSKIYFLRATDGRCGIVFVVSHMVMDSWAISTFYKDIFQIYDAIAGSKDMPKPLYPYEDLLQEELAYADSEQYRQDLMFWQSELEGTEPIYTHVNGKTELAKYRKKKRNNQLRYGPFFRLFSRAKNVMLPLPADLVSTMETYCMENKITMQSIVLVALRSYFAMVNEVNDVNMYTVIARRGKLREKNTGGSRVHYMPCRTVFEDTDSFLDQSSAISGKLSTIFRHSNINPCEVTNIWAKKYKVPQLATYTTGILTYQPVKLELADGTRIETKWYSNGAIATPFYLTVMDGDASGGLKFYYEYHVHGIQIETIERLHSYMIDYIARGIGCAVSTDE